MSDSENTNTTDSDDSQDDAKAGFDSIRQISPYGAEYWSARDLYLLLGYDTWRRFETAIERAKIACANMGEEVADHFAGAVKMIEVGKGAQREASDYALSRFGCYLTAMNGDPRKPEIANAQGYFAVQTRRMEQWDELRESLAERAERRQQLTEANKHLNATAQVHGLERHSFGRLHDAGTKGLYGGRSVHDLKTIKGIAGKEDFADRMGLEELAANLFVRTQTEAKVRNEQIRGSDAIVGAHYEVGAETRTVIERIGGTKPEELPAEPSIRPLLAQRERQSKKQLPQQDGPTLFDDLGPSDDDKPQ
ncbi:MAG: DNA-damage-inducible protein D [Ktedonobacterales bacterium]|nr:MAG: DNA-damage-inducible protein D [Ktedonobacterales bacterium]